MVWAVAAVAKDEPEVVTGFGEGRGDAEVIGKPVPLAFVPAQVAVAGLPRTSPLGSRYHQPSWNTMTEAGSAGLYWAGT